MDRYRGIQFAEDLGGIEMFPDRTPDLRKDKTPDTANLGGSGVEGFNPFEKEQ
ncbi:hypothetical protein [Williamsia sp. 1135]|uniref:hypothetical protein n=1 Tax=Williamsia sp. 1135 TaxID=1889262 RepID=UPI00143AB227|nr:hypothetical protein [Williamsia sp. 1135]